MTTYVKWSKRYPATNLFNVASPTMKKFIMENLQETAPWALNAVIVPTNMTVGEILSSDDNSQAKAKTQNGYTTPTSQKNGRTDLTITLKEDDGQTSHKIFRTSDEDAKDFIDQLNNETEFVTLTTSEKTSYTFPKKAIYNIKSEKEDEPKVSKSKGKKTSAMGSGETTKSDD